MGMASNANAPIIIKRKKVVAGGGHHGGAWKVAYADFVTAMMAFFLLMWLLNATTEKQRKGLADHFSPTIPINRSSGGGDGALGGDSIFTEETLSQSGVGASSPDAFTQPLSQDAAGADGEDNAEFLEMETMLLGSGAEALLSERELRHIVTRITDEGLVVEIFSLDGAPLFAPGTDEATPLLNRLLDVVGTLFARTTNQVAVAGFSRAHAVVLFDNPAWDRSLARADHAKTRMEDLIEPSRLHRVTGHGDRRPVLPNPMALRNDRIELTLLRSDIAR
ncbi:MAG: flagellar motor protein MotB [Pseudomonadota bacterium]